MEIDSIHDTIKTLDTIDHEYLNRIKPVIESQYIHFDNLGMNMLDQIELKYQLLIIDDFFEYVHKHYTSIINYDESLINPNVKYMIGYKVYQFISTDFYLTIFPSLLESLNIATLNDFYKCLEYNTHDNYIKLKGSLVNCVKKIYDNVKKLESIDKHINKDKNFKELLDKYSFYIKLINFGDIEKFINDFCVPIFEKNEDEIIWTLT